jgi:hypothetical protein
LNHQITQNLFITMKKLFFLLISYLSSFITYAQSITLTPNTADNANVTEFKKNGIGLDHRNSTGLVGVGTYANAAGGFIQTHTNHPLNFSTNNGNAQMTLTTAGNFGIGTLTPLNKLHVVGNAFISGNLDSDGLITGATLNIGGGSTINKYLEVSLAGQQIFGIVNNTCDVQYYTVAGVNTGDAVILNMESAFSTLTVANVRASGFNQVEVKFCNIGNANTILQTGLAMRFTVFK